jgi:CheY-like chemotaxis protein
MLFAQLLALLPEIARLTDETAVCGDRSVGIPDVMHRILIVDDSATIRKMVRACLRPLGSVEFVDASSGLEAIEQIALGAVALMILDLNMPDMHGMDVLRFVRKHQGLRSMPKSFSTGWPTPCLSAYEGEDLARGRFGVGAARCSTDARVGGI